MKASKQRKMMRAIVSNKGLHHRESVRIDKAQQKVADNYDFLKPLNKKSLSGCMNMNGRRID